jgi:hypothetical protein
MEPTGRTQVAMSRVSGALAVKSGRHCRPVGQADDMRGLSRHDLVDSREPAMGRGAVASLWVQVEELEELHVDNLRALGDYPGLPGRRRLMRSAPRQLDRLAVSAAGPVRSERGLSGGRATSGRRKGQGPTE